jgi:hypothetical protein
MLSRMHHPYIKYSGNPVIDFSGRGDNRQFEDAYVWMEKGKFNMKWLAVEGPKDSLL